MKEYDLNIVALWQCKSGEKTKIISCQDVGQQTVLRRSLKKGHWWTSTDPIDNFSIQIISEEPREYWILTKSQVQSLSKYKEFLWIDISISPNSL